MISYYVDGLKIHLLQNEPSLRLFEGETSLACSVGTKHCVGTDFNPFEKNIKIQYEVP